MLSLTQDAIDWANHHLQSLISGDLESPWILISVAHQSLGLIDRNQFVFQAPISTAAAGLGTRINSQKTPYGLFAIAEKIGGGRPLDTIFVGRNPVGRLGKDSSALDLNEDRIIARILWLDGLQPGLNRGGDVDTRQRYIYLHGTDHESLIGRPVSHGCIRMRPVDVADLYERVRVGTLVYIPHPDQFDEFAVSR